MPPFRSLATLLALTLATSTAAQHQALATREVVRIYYDGRMVPHVFGETDEAAFFGLGYHHVREFPIGTLNMLWLHSGRMAEVAGPSYLDEDRLVRLWDVPAVAQRHRDELRREKLLPLIRAYVRGVEAGRRWWREDGDPAQSARLDALFGDDLTVYVDPVPDYLNPAFSPFGAFDDPNVPAQMRAVVDRMFDPDLPVTVDHVLRLGACINSFFLLRANPVELSALPDGVPPTLPIDPSPLEDYGVVTNTQAVKASNGWLISPGGILNGGVMTATDSHVVLNKLHVRPYLVQVHGDRFQATGLSMPGYPGVYMGFSERLSWFFTAPAGDPVAHNRWRVTLEPSPDPEQLRFRFDTGDAVDLVELEEVKETLRYFDPATGTEETYDDTRYYVPRHSRESPALGFQRYPVVPQTADVPLPGADVYFEQAPFTRESSPWETMIRFGRARDARHDLNELARNSLLIFGNGNNLLVADRDGFFRYLFMARIPRQGADVPSSMYAEDAVLDGSKLSWRWQGYHGLDELPQIGPANVSGAKEVWINNNVTPDLIETSRFTEADLAAFPEYMVPNQSVASWRQLRAVEFLRDKPQFNGLSINEAVASDVRFTWMHMLWPFYQQAGALVPGGLSPDAQLLADWIEEYRSHDENDQPRATHDFEAHRFSQVMVYAVLLRSHYLSELERLVGTAGVATTSDQATFGHDPLHPLFDDPTLFTYAAYGPNVDAMAFAFETVAPLWKQGDGLFGLVNQSLLADLGDGIAGDPWGDPRYDTPIEPHWRGVIAGDRMTRWGHVNMGVLTPHYLPPPKQVFVEGVPSRGGDEFEFLRGHAYSGLAPALLANLSYDLLKIPFYQGQTPRARPLPGVDTALFLPRHLPIFNQPAPLGYEQSVYGWSASESFEWHPQTQGSQTLMTVYLVPGIPTRARFRAAIGGTEITVPDLLGDGSLAYQDRFGPSKDFADGQWHPLETIEARLGNPELVLTYEPYTVVESP